jgi:hypothetical protein
VWYGIAPWLEEDKDDNDNDGYVLVTVKLYLYSAITVVFHMYTGLKKGLRRI